MLQLENVAIRYGSDSDIVRDVNVHIRSGSFHFLTGPSGAGKTSILKLMYLALRPAAGRVSMFGQDVSHLPRRELPPLRRRIGVVFQDFRLLDHLTAFDNVSLPLRIQGLTDEAYREDVEELLTWVGLGERLDWKPPTLSGGEQQRVAIARAVVAKPELLLADEPTGNVDPQMGQRLMKLFVELNKLGTSVVIATHDEAMVRQLSVPVLRLQGGTVRTEAPRQKVSA